VLEGYVWGCRMPQSPPRDVGLYALYRGKLN
jgi:hypothetical protein